MIYIYDILLSFSSSLYEFYEWKKEELVHFRKIGLFKVSSDLICNIYNKKVCIDKSFLELLCNKSEVILGSNLIKMSNICIFTDGIEFIGAKFNEDGLIVEKSKLFISDEIELRDVTSNINSILLDYNVYECDFELKKLRIETDIEDKIINVLENNLSDYLINYLNLEWFCEDKVDKRFLINKVKNLGYFDKKRFFNMLMSVL